MEAHPKSEKSTSNFTNCKITLNFFQRCPKEKEGNWFLLPWAAALTGRTTLKIITNSEIPIITLRKAFLQSWAVTAGSDTHQSPGLDIGGIKSSLLPAGLAGQDTGMRKASRSCLF